MNESSESITSTPVDARSHLNQVFSGNDLDEHTDGFYPRDDYRVHIPNFEGPLDLLLHLIRKEQLDIYDIPVARICERYLNHLELMQQYDVNVAGEFILMAATLTYLKSVVLLPKEETDAEEDPRLPLVQQLLEYERYKLAAQEFESRPWLMRELFPRPESAISELIPEEELRNAPMAPIEIFALLSQYKVAMDRTYRKPIQIEVETVSIRQKVADVTQTLSISETMDFMDLLPSNYGRKDVIVAFLAILELAKLRFIEIIQLMTFGPIQLRKNRDVKELDVSMLDSY